MTYMLPFPLQASLSQKTESSVPTETHALTVSKLEQTAQAAQEETALLREELQALIMQMEKLRNQTLETEKDNALLHHALLAAQRTCSEQHQEIIQLTAEQSAAARDYAKLKEELTVLQEENVQLQDQQTQLRHSLTESHALCNATQETYNTLKQSYQALQDDFKTKQQDLHSSQIECGRLQAKSDILLQDRANLVSSLASLMEGFCTTQAELLFAKELLVEKTKKSSENFVWQEEAKTKIERLEGELTGYHQNANLQQNAIERLQQNEQQLIKRLDEESAASNERTSALKKDYTQMMHQAQAAQEELTRYRELQERLLPLQRFVQNLAPFLRHGGNTPFTKAILPTIQQVTGQTGQTIGQITGQAIGQTTGGSSSMGSPMDFHEETWTEAHYAYGYRPVKNPGLDP